MKILYIIILSLSITGLQGCASNKQISKTIPNLETEHNKSINKPLSMSKSFPIQLFMNICVISRGDRTVIANRSKKFRLTEAPPNVASRYLSGHKGKVWGMKNEYGFFVVSSLSNGLCSVFIHRGNTGQLKASMESWLLPKNTGITYTKDSINKKGLNTTTYKIFRGSQALEQWVITIPKNINGNLKAIMSYQAAKV